MHVTLKLDRASPLAERAYDAIKQMVIANELVPGQALTESGLAQSLGISRSPVRAALGRLQEEGFIETEPWKGPRVAPLDAKYVRNLYEVRTALETLSARLSASRIPDEDIKRLDDAVTSAKSSSNGREGALDVIDLEIHALIIEHCDNDLLRLMLRRLQDHLARVRNAASRDTRTRIPADGQELASILAAMQKHDSARLGEVLKRHIDNYATRMLESFEG
jgi:DNA-binding GntR family transcriptional regulator